MVATGGQTGDCGKPANIFSLPTGDAYLAYVSPLDMATEANELLASAVGMVVSEVFEELYP